MPFFVKMYFLLLKQIDIRRFHIYNIIYIGFCIFMGAEKYAIYYNNCEELDTKIIDEELLGVHDGNNATKMLFDLLLILSKYDYSYAEAKLITIYNRTDLYSSKALEILVITVRLN